MSTTRVIGYSHKEARMEHTKEVLAQLRAERMGVVKKIDAHEYNGNVELFNLVGQKRDLKRRIQNIVRMMEEG